ncbi:hypothetical protein AVEN_50561-1 [Araneus ventricosus]|uniref:Uncharacterized protein n=1 Tax=Araneus ventricosus TaxID=182803 RepID=A0A4Y2APZ7_ARAVE|nr:hypothetical protein AVEN_50561-1 [Araneus ventricosus]
MDDNRVLNVGPRQTVVTSENVAKVSGIVQQNPRNTVLRLASETGLKRSNESSAKQIKSCIHTLKPKEYQSYFQFLSNNYYSFNSDSLDGKISEYCSYDNDKKQDVFDKITDAKFGFLKKSSDEGNEGTQSRITKAITCEYNLYQKLQSEGKCQKES